MKILAFAASNSANSINKMFVESVSKYYKEIEDEIVVLDLNDFQMPVFSKEIEKDQGIPKLATRFAQHVDWSDLVLIS